MSLVFILYRFYKNHGGKIKWNKSLWDMLLSYNNTCRVDTCNTHKAVSIIGATQSADPNKWLDL